MSPEQNSTNRRDKITVAIIVFVLAVAALGLVIGLGMQVWSYRHEPPQQSMTQ